VIDLELLEQAYASVPEPDAAAVDAARTAFLAEIGTRPARRRLRLAVTVALAVAAGVVAAVVFLPNRAEGLPGKKIIRAAYVASLPPARGIRHVREVLSTVGFAQKGINDYWSSVRHPFAILVRHSGGMETEWTACGSIDLDRRGNRLSFNRWNVPATVQRTLRLEADPLLSFQKAYRSHLVTFAGKTTFNEQPAYKLVTVQDDTKITYLVAQASYRPLRVTRVVPGQTTITTFLVYETLPWTTTTRQLLHIHLHLSAPLYNGKDFYRVDRCIR
jgi:hypothetical protein